MTDAPANEPGNDPEPPADSPGPDEISSGRAAYNVVSDVAIGVNFRKSDNWFQFVFISISVCIVGIVGTVLALLYGGQDMPWFFGSMAGAFAGLIFGAFASGIYLMIYRAVRHAKGKHD